MILSQGARYGRDEVGWGSIPIGSKQGISDISTVTCNEGQPRDLCAFSPSGHLSKIICFFHFMI